MASKLFKNCLRDSIFKILIQPPPGLCILDISFLLKYCLWFVGTRFGLNAYIGAGSHQQELKDCRKKPS